MVLWPLDHAMARWYGVAVHGMVVDHGMIRADLRRLGAGIEPESGNMRGVMNSAHVSARSMCVFGGGDSGGGDSGGGGGGGAGAGGGGAGGGVCVCV